MKLLKSKEIERMAGLIEAAADERVRRAAATTSSAAVDVRVKSVGDICILREKLLRFII